MEAIHDSGFARLGWTGLDPNLQNVCMRIVAEALAMESRTAPLSGSCTLTPFTFDFLFNPQSSDPISDKYYRDFMFTWPEADYPEGVSGGGL